VIISHKHRFVFVKTNKTAGTSVEVFLSQIAGEDAVVTPIDPPVEGHRPRNYELPGRVAGRLRYRAGAARRDALDLLRRTETRKKPAYYNHSSAIRIRNYLGTARWNSYFTFSLDRNPWDKIMSMYFYRGWDKEMTLREYVLNGRLPSDFFLYSFDGRTVGVDYVARYEHLEDDLRYILAHRGIDYPVTLTKEKGWFRPQRATVESMFDEEMNARVEKVFAREIALLHYERPRESATRDQLA
jgi:hypothetical protein